MLEGKEILRADVKFKRTGRFRSFGLIKLLEDAGSPLNMNGNWSMLKMWRQTRIFGLIESTIDRQIQHPAPQGQCN